MFLLAAAVTQGRACLSRYVNSIQALTFLFTFTHCIFQNVVLAVPLGHCGSVFNRVVASQVARYFYCFPFIIAQKRASSLLLRNHLRSYAMKRKKKKKKADIGMGNKQAIWRSRCRILLYKWRNHRIDEATIYLNDPVEKPEIVQWVLHSKSTPLTMPSTISVA